MTSYLTLFAVLLIGFAVYFVFRDYLFEPSEEFKQYPVDSSPSPASIEIRQASPYPPRQIAASGPNPPSQSGSPDERTIYAPPSPADPYAETQEDSEIPEHLRHPERSFRPPPLNEERGIAVQSGIASQTVQTSADSSQMYQQEMIQGGGEFMPGIFANDMMNDTSYSSF